MDNLRSKFPVIVCLSGGVDSTALLYYYQSKGCPVRAIHFDYGQPSLRGERTAVNAVSDFFCLDCQRVEIQPSLSMEASGEFKGRNLVFVLAVLSQLNLDYGLISLGIHANSPYYDCTHSFVQDTQRILDGYFGGTIVLDAPWLHFSKADIYAYCQQNQIPIALTYSCERNSEFPCGCCPSCRERSRYGFG